MTKEELEKVVQGAEYDFLRENPHLGSNIMFLTLGGSHAVATHTGCVRLKRLKPSSYLVSRCNPHGLR